MVRFSKELLTLELADRREKLYRAQFEWARAKQEAFTKATLVLQLERAVQACEDFMASFDGYIPPASTSPSTQDMPGPLETTNPTEHL